MKAQHVVSVTGAVEVGVRGGLIDEGLKLNEPELYPWALQSFDLAHLVERSRQMVSDNGQIIWDRFRLVSGLYCHRQHRDPRLA